MATRVMPIGLGFVNAYLVKSDESYVLVDTGMPGQWKQLQEKLKSNGCYPGLLKAIILTHADIDHSGNCVTLKERFRAPILAHALDSPALLTGEAPKRAIRPFSARILLGILRLLRRLGRKSGAFQTFTPDAVLEDGQSLAEYGLAARVVHLPGHTKGSIGILTEDGELLAGDLYTNRHRPGLSPYVENLAEYRASTVKARELAGSITTVYPGHGRPFPARELQGLEP